MKDFLTSLIKKDIHIDLVDGELSIKFPENGMDDITLDNIKSRKQAIKDYLNGLKKYEFTAIPISGNSDHYPLSSAQRRLWILSQFENGSVTYNMPGMIHLSQDINISSFRKAFNSTIDRHEILRTVFKTDEKGEIRQWVLNRDDIGFNIDYADIRKENNKEEKVKEYITSDSYKVFDLENGPLLRASLLQVGDKEYVFYFNMHHIIGDGWSFDILSRDVLSYYEAYKLNKGSDPIAVGLKELRIQYKDYSVWQIAQEEKESFKSHRNYWLNSLAGELPFLDLPSRKQRPRIRTNNGIVLSTYIDSETTGKLRNYSHANGGSVFIGILATWNILMFRYTGQTDIILGTPIAGRDHPDLEDQIGCYVNTLALRNEIKPDESFDFFYRRLKDHTLKSYSHQLYPFDKLVEELDLAKNIGRSAVFDISITYYNRIEASEGDALDTRVINQITCAGPSKVKFDIELHFKEIGDYLSFNLIYNEDVYDREMVECLMVHYKQLLNSLLAHPEGRIGQAKYLSEKEKRKLLFTFNDTEVTYPKDKTIIELFEEQVLKNPDHIAVVCSEKELTYQELNEQSNQLAHYLRNNCSIVTEDLVGIQLDRSELVIISILGILKAGGAYVPIDPDYPDTRKQHIIEETSIKLLITEANFLMDIDYYQGAIFAIDVEFNALPYNSESLKVSSTCNNLAYVIYTSGSTGKPKGVMVEQRSVVRLVKNTNIYSFSSSDRLLSTGAISFDATTFEYWGPLLNGGQLVLCSQRILFDNELLSEEIKRRSINIMWFTSGWLNQLVDSAIEIFGRLNTVLAGGDKLSPSHIKKLRKSYPELKIINGYGPTENTTFSITHNILEVTGDIPLGNPINNTQIYLLDQSEELLPIGVTGEICIGGDGLARGYLNQAELTKDKFIDNPFREGGRLYKTGDLGRWTIDGTIEFIGRKDDQVKIRGYRIELGEIEYALLKNEQIEESVVVVKENEKNEKEIVAYITAKSVQKTNEIRSYLKEILPEYMLPAYYVQLQEFPLNRNGKIDKKSLPDPDGLILSSGVTYIAPRNVIEEKLVKIWEEVLMREHIGVTDDFFELGGHSLKAMKLLMEYNKIFNVRLSLQDIFMKTQLASHAELIEIWDWMKVDPSDEIPEENMNTVKF